MKGKIVYLVLLVLLTASCRGFTQNQKSDVTGGNNDEDFAMKREEMVNRQLEARGINDPRVLAAMRNVQRHRFVHSLLEALAYNVFCS